MSALEHAVDRILALEQEHARERAIALARSLPALLCPRCLLRGEAVRLMIGHLCHDADRICRHCRSPLDVRVAARDARGSLSETQSCGCPQARGAR